MPFLNVITGKQWSLCFATILFACIGHTQADDWTEFRGPTGQGISSHTGLPLHWSKNPQAAWKRDLPGTGWSSPVVSDGRIYLTTAVPVGKEKLASESKFKKAVENAFSLRAICLDQNSGKIVWNTEVARVPPKTSIHPKNSHASGTPLINDDRLYVHFGTFGTAALDLDGNILWQRQIGYQPVHGCGGSPIVFEDQLIFHCDGGDAAFVIALDSNTGQTRWKTPREIDEGNTFSFSTPLLIESNGRPLLISSASNAVYGYDPKTGEQIWLVQYPNKWSIVPRPVFAEGLVLICTGYAPPAEMLAIRPDGQGDVTETHVVWRVDKFVPYNPSPVVHQNAVYLVSDNGIASCRDLQTGELHWKRRLGDDHSASPFLAEGKVFFLSEEGVCTVIEANTTRYSELAKNDVEQRTLASMVPISGAILLRTESALYRLQK